MSRFDNPACDPLAASTDPSVLAQVEDLAGGWTVTMRPTDAYLARVHPTAAVALRARLVAEMIDAGCSPAEAVAQVAHLEEMTR